jgi:hypothetical protein
MFAKKDVEIDQLREGRGPGRGVNTEVVATTQVKSLSAVADARSGPTRR